MSGTSKLRWAEHDGVHQPALVIPPEELADTELPLGHTAVYLLGLDLTVLVPDHGVTPYDPQDTVKMSNPAAALGVATAQQILEGFQGKEEGEGEGEAPSPESGDAPAKSAALDLQLLTDDEEDPLAQTNSAVQGREPVGDGEDDDEEARRRHREEKKARKAAKKAAKEAKKAAVKREREEITSVPTLRAAPLQDEEDEDNGLLAAMAIEKKYGPATVKAAKRKHQHSSDEEEIGEADEEDEAGDRRHSKSKKKHGGAVEGSWAALEEDLFSDEDEEEGDDDDAELNDGSRHRGAATTGGVDPSRLAKDAAAAQSRVRSSGSAGNNRLGQALSALHATSVAQDIPGLANACPYAHPYLMEIHYEYERLAQEAVTDGLLLTVQKGEVVRAIDFDLRRKAAEKTFLESILRDREQQLRSNAFSSSSTATVDLRSAISALQDAAVKLDAPLSVADTVRRLVGKQMPASLAAFDRAAAQRARRAVQRRTRTFQDVSVVTLVDQLRSLDAAPREDAAETMRKYIQQRRQHEDLKSNFRGLSKTGFFAIPKPLEKWKRARDMMLIANVGAEAQKVRPTSYISQAYSTMRQRMKQHAEKRYDRMAVAARDGASFLDMSSFIGAAMTPSSPAAASSFTPQQLHSMELQQQQHRLNASAGAASMQRREAFFQFHNLRCDTEAPVTLETVALNPGFAGANQNSLLSQNLLSSTDLTMGSTGPAGGMGGGDDTTQPQQHEESLRSDYDDASQLSYSAHSAAPSSYAFIFDHEESTRPARRGGGAGHLGSRGGYASDADSAHGASTRATSVASHSVRHGSNGSSVHNGHTMDSAAAATGTNASANTADWRANAKRSILEQLTLYRRGRGGKPAILDEDQCRAIAKMLLDRAMRAEAARQGVSLTVQSNNMAAPFTKTTEQRLKKSVDHFVERRMAQQHMGTAATHEAAPAESGVLGAPGVLPLPAHAQAGVLADDAAAVSRQRAVADTPVYEN